MVSAIVWPTCRGCGSAEVVLVNSTELYNGSSPGRGNGDDQGHLRVDFGFGCFSFAIRSRKFGMKFPKDFQKTEFFNCGRPCRIGTGASGGLKELLTFNKRERFLPVHNASFAISDLTTHTLSLHPRHRHVAQFRDPAPVDYRAAVHRSGDAGPMILRHASTLESFWRADGRVPGRRRGQRVGGASAGPSVDQHRGTCHRQSVTAVTLPLTMTR
jgi:hypothetical protein